MQTPPETEDEEDCDEIEPIVVETFGERRLPECGMNDDDVAMLDVPYSTRAKTDWVVSGPVGEEGRGTRGRHFWSWESAERWARHKYGNKFRGRIQDAVDCGPRWAFLIAQLEVN